MADVEVLKTVGAVADATSRPGGQTEPVDWTEFAERLCGLEPKP